MKSTEKNSTLAWKGLTDRCRCLRMKWLIAESHAKIDNKQISLWFTQKKGLLPREIFFSVHCHFLLPVHHLVINFSYSLSAKSIFNFPHSAFCVTASSLSPIMCWLSICWISRLGWTWVVFGSWKRVLVSWGFFNPYFLCFVLAQKWLHSSTLLLNKWVEKCLCRSICAVLMAP